MSDSKYLSTADAAEALGVSVSSVKRWVDRGVMAAHKTAGGHRKLLVADVVRLARAGAIPNVDLTRLDAKLAGACSSHAQLEKRLRRALEGGRAEDARSVLRGAQSTGISIADLADHVIAPVMRHIGHEWEHERIDVMHEHRASQICIGALQELRSTLVANSGPPGAVAIGGAPEGDWYRLSSLLVELLFFEHGWSATNLGPSTPLASFVKAVEEVRPRLAWISISHVEDEESLVLGCRELYRRCERDGIALVIGGRALDANLRAALVASTFCDNFAHLAAFIGALAPRPGRPKRGRPRKTD